MSDMLKVKRLLDLAAIEMDMPDSQQVAEFLVENNVVVLGENCKNKRLRTEIKALRQELDKRKNLEHACKAFQQCLKINKEEIAEYKQKYAQKCEEFERLKKEYGTSLANKR